MAATAQKQEVAADPDAPAMGVTRDKRPGMQVGTTYKINPTAYQAKILLAPTVRLGEVSPGIVGMCLVPGRGEEGGLDLGAFGPLLQGSSARVWLNSTQADAVHFKSLAPLIRSMNTAEFLIVFPPAVLAVKAAKIKAHYVSETDNNLPAITQPSNVARMAVSAYDQLLELTENRTKRIFFEAYNEPQFVPKGDWEPEQMAAYSRDVARLIKRERPNLLVAMPLHLGSAAWNDAALRSLAPDDIDGVVNHSYGTAWISRSKAVGETYLSRAGEVVRQNQILSEDLALVHKYGKGKWHFAITEWGIHPEGYTGAFPASTDITSALYDALMLKTFAEIGISSAQRFHLLGNSHFAVARAGLPTRPFAPYYSFVLFRRYLVGERIALTVDAPTFPWSVVGPTIVDPKPRWARRANVDCTVPYLHGFAVTHADGALGLMLVNLDPERPARVEIESPVPVFKGPVVGERLEPAKPGQPEIEDYRTSLLGPEEVSASTERHAFITLPPSSLTVLSFPNVVP